MWTLTYLLSCFLFNYLYIYSQFVFTFIFADDRPTCSEINCGRKHTCLVDLLTLEPRCVSCSYKCARKRRPTVGATPIN